MARIIAPFDGGLASEHALAIACQSVTGLADEVQAIYVARVPPQLPIGAEVPAVRARAEGVFARAEAIAKGYGIPLTALLVMARSVGLGIVAAARGGDILVMGQRPRRLAGRVLGYRALRYVLAHAPCDVLVAYVPAPHARAGTEQYRLVRPGAVGRPPGKVGKAGNVLVFPVPLGVDAVVQRGKG